VQDTGRRDYGAQHEVLDGLVRGGQRPAAERRLACYFAEPAAGRRSVTGRRFERFASGGPAGEVTAADVLSLSLLSVEWGLGRVAIAVLEAKAEAISALLRLVPDGLALHEVTPGAKAATSGKHSPAWQLWEVLATAGGGHWSVTACKLMALKRPALFPPFDARVAHVLGVRLSIFDPWLPMAGPGLASMTASPMVLSSSSSADSDARARLVKRSRRSRASRSP